MTTHELTDRDECEFAVLLGRLTRLLADGQDDEYADRLRDRMDSHWARMTDAGRDRMRKLSVELDRA